MSAAAAAFWRSGRGVGCATLAAAVAVVPRTIITGVLVAVAPARAGGCREIVVVAVADVAIVS